MQVWRIKHFEEVAVPEQSHGQFFSGDCYVVVYSYGEGAAQHIVYMWQGAAASQDERGACALAAVRRDEHHCRGTAPQVRAH
jgi:Gelsolin repeat